MKKQFLVLLASAVLAAESQATPFGYTTNFNDGTVSVFDTADNAVDTTIMVGINPTGIAISPDGSAVYITNLFGPEEVKVIDAVTNTVVIGVPTGSNPEGIEILPQGTFIYVANRGDDTVSVIDASNNTVVGPPIAVGNEPGSVVAHPNGSRVYVANQSDASLSVIDTSNNTVVATIPIAGDPGVLAISPSGDELYVVNSSGGNLFVVDTSNNTVTGAPIPVSADPDSARFHPNGQLVYVSDGSGAPLSIVDVATRSVTASIPNVGTECHGVDFYPAGQFAYVACAFPDEVAVIDTASQTIVDRIIVGGSPFSNGRFIGPAAIIQLSSTSLNFGNQDVNTLSSPQQITLTNIGNLPLDISDITASANFPVTDDCGVSLPPGESCILTVVFSPTTAGDLSGNVTILSNAPDSPQLINLNGVGVASIVNPFLSGAGCSLVRTAASSETWWFLSPLAWLAIRRLWGFRN